MKLNKIVITGLVATTLMLGACTPEKPVEPLQRIVISKVTSAFVVGDTFDLDEFVTVQGGKGPKVYTATAAAGSEDVISFGTKKDAHKITVLKEGEIKIKVVAEQGETTKTANFTAKAMGRLKAAYYSVTKDIIYDIGFDGIEEGKDGAEVITEHIRHRENYFYDTMLNTETNKWAGLGLIRFASGNGYEFSAQGFECNDFTIVERLSSDFGNYFAAMEWMLTVEDLVTKEYANGEEYLELDTTLGAPHSTYFSSLAEEVINNSFYLDVAEIGYNLTSLDIVEDPANAGKFLFKIMATKGKSKTVSEIATYRMVTGDDVKVDRLEKALKDNEEPDPIEYDSLTAAIDAFAEADNYTVTYETQWYRVNGNKLVPTTLAAEKDTQYLSSWMTYYPNGTETSKVDLVNHAKRTTITSEEGAAYNGCDSGYFAKDDVLYMFTNESEVETGVCEGEPVSEKSENTIEEYESVATMKVLHSSQDYMEGLDPSNYEVDEDNTEVYTFNGGGANLGFAAYSLYNSDTFGFRFLSQITSGLKDLDSLPYLTMWVSIYADKLVFEYQYGCNFGENDGVAYYTASMTFSAKNETTVDVSDIALPTVE